MQVNIVHSIQLLYTCCFSKGKNNPDIHLDSGFDSSAKLKCFHLSLESLKGGGNTRALLSCQIQNPG